ILSSKLKNMPHVKAVDGLGLMLGITFDDHIDAKEIVKEAIPAGALFLTAKNKLRLLPPLIITEEEIQKGMNILEKILLKLGEK
ncbi:MAG: aminotransferase class III-fold pyridoxal phosphate-dependent enzyme, partial [Coprobacillaceae bacterium]